MLLPAAKINKTWLSTIVVLNCIIIILNIIAFIFMVKIRMQSWIKTWLKVYKYTVKICSSVSL